jgi:hypothetical protein
VLILETNAIKIFSNCDDIGKEPSVTETISFARAKEVYSLIGFLADCLI